jgi:hypothetical protein
MYFRALIGPEFRQMLGIVPITVGIGPSFYTVVERCGGIYSL